MCTHTYTYVCVGVFLIEFQFVSIHFQAAREKMFHIEFESELENVRFFEPESEEMKETEDAKKNIYGTPYSMNRLFSEFFTEFSGVILRECETIWRLFGGNFERISMVKLFNE